MNSYFAVLGRDLYTVSSTPCHLHRDIYLLLLSFLLLLSAADRFIVFTKTAQYTDAVSQVTSLEEGRPPDHRLTGLNLVAAVGYYVEPTGRIATCKNVQFPLGAERLGSVLHQRCGLGRGRCGHRSCSWRSSLQVQHEQLYVTVQRSPKNDRPAVDSFHSVSRLARQRQSTSRLTRQHQSVSRLARQRLRRIACAGQGQG